MPPSLSLPVPACPKHRRAAQKATNKSSLSLPSLRRSPLAFPKHSPPLFPTRPPCSPLHEVRVSRLALYFRKTYATVFTSSPHPRPCKNQINSLPPSLTRLAMFVQSFGPDSSTSCFSCRLCSSVQRCAAAGGFFSWNKDGCAPTPTGSPPPLPINSRDSNAEGTEGGGGSICPDI